MLTYNRQAMYLITCVSLSFLFVNELGVCLRCACCIEALYVAICMCGRASIEISVTALWTAETPAVI